MFRNILSLVPNRSFSSLSGTLAENGNLSWASSEKTAFTVPALLGGDTTAEGLERTGDAFNDVPRAEFSLKPYYQMGN